MSKFFKLGFIFMLICLSGFTQPSVYEYKLSEDSQQALLELRLKRKICVILNDLDKLELLLYSDLNAQIESFFSKANANAHSYAQQASSYFFASDDNRKELKALFEKLIFSSNDLQVLQDRLNDYACIKLKDKIDEILFKNDVISEIDFNNLRLNSADVGNYKEDMNFTNRNKLNLALKGAEIALDLYLGISFFKSICLALALDQVAPWNTYDPADNVEIQVVNSLSIIKTKIKKAVKINIKENFKHFKVKVEKALQEKFRKEFMGGNK
jgi:hypothetical protein